MLLRNIPIQRKLMTANLLTSAAVLLLTSLTFLLYEIHSYKENSKSQLSVLGEIIAKNSTAALAFESKEDAKEILMSLESEPHIIGAVLYDVSGNIFSYYPENFETKDIILRQDPVGYELRGNFLDGFQPVFQGNKMLGTLYLRLDIKELHDRLYLYLVVTLAVIILSSMLAYWLSGIFKASIARPILSLASTARAVSVDHDYSVRATKIGNDEIGLLTEAFNQMLVRIQEQNDELSEFNKNLERKVKERTRALEIANREQVEAQNEIYSKNMELAQTLEEVQSMQDQLVELNKELEVRVQERTKSLQQRETEVLAKNDELKRINTDLDNFIYTASHDLKAPISNIEGLTSVLIKKLNGRLTEEEAKVVEMISLSIAKFKKTILDLTEISKVQKNLEGEEETVFFKEILEDLKMEVQQEIENTGATLQENLEVASIQFARKNIKSIMYNLISNAIKYRSPDRNLIIEIRTYREGNFNVLSVKDNGLGLNKEHLPKLFIMFKRLHTHVEGTGIGLYIVKRIVENKGGKIEVSSDLNAGTEFKVYLP